MFWLPSQVLSSAGRRCVVTAALSDHVMSQETLITSMHANAHTGQVGETWEQHNHSADMACGGVELTGRAEVKHTLKIHKVLR